MLVGGRGGRTGGWGPRFLLGRMCRRGVERVDVDALSV
jgi:hypothetical protein